MKVEDIMSKQVECVLPRSSLTEAASKMKDQDVGCLAVTDDGTPVGLVTDRDIALRGVANGKGPNDATVADVLTQGVIWCRQDDDLETAAHRMEERGVRRLLVQDDDGQLAGVLSLGDVAHRDESTAGRVLGRIFEA